MSEKAFFQAGTLLAVVLLAGCVATPEGDYGTNSAELVGVVDVKRITNPPENATVVQADRVTAGGPLEKALQQALNTSETGTLVRRGLSRSQYHEIKNRLEDVPRYRGAEYGYYVRYEGHLFHVQILRNR